MIKKSNYYLIPLVILLTIYSSTNNSSTSQVSQTQTKLNELNGKIDLLKRTLASANDRRGALNKELSGTEKKIGEGVQKLHLIELTMQTKEQKITQLQNKATELNRLLVIQQQLLANHVRAHYEMGEYQPLKWLLDQETPYQINRLLTYYQYIIQSRKDLIIQIAKTRKTIKVNQNTLHSELAQNINLQKQLLENQQKLTQDKSYHTALINSLNSEIEDKEHALHEFEKDKTNLSRLLLNLAQNSSAKSTLSFAAMRKKLQRPVQTNGAHPVHMNQGLTFFADEGTKVTAVFPGKVVFSDWLRGYGLLLIIDHGQGFMTLYAHNQSLFKQKGQTVQQNEQIARVGHSGGIKQNGLYFEIRLRGKAISPQEWLI